MIKTKRISLRSCVVGESARSYVVMNSEKEKSNKVPTSGVSETLEKDSIHLYNGKDFGKDYSNDLAVVVTKKPVEAMTGGEDSPRELSHKRFLLVIKSLWSISQ